ncbi:MAG: hypothetical protein AAB525_02630 [Patescibacteria group bacterium]
MRETQSSLELNSSETEKKEYSFNEGLEEIKRQVTSLLKSKDYVVIAFNASGTDVGKTYLSGAMRSWCYEQEIPFCNCPQDYSLQDGIDAFLGEQLEFNRSGGVIILEGSAGVFFRESRDLIISFKQARNTSLAAIGEEIGLPLNSIDIWVAIYRPDKPFQLDKSTDELLGDIIIRNEGAKDKPYPL